MNNEILKTSIKDVIKANGNQEITGPVLQQALLSIINQFGSGSIFGGFAEPSTNPINTDVNMFYIAKSPGNYINFGNYFLGTDNIAIFNNKSGIWAVENFISVKSISSVDKTGTSGLVDTYTITYTDESTPTTFQVTNGKNGFSNLNFLGVYDAENNIPNLSDTIGNNDEYYIVNVPGNQNLGSGDLIMQSGDNLIYFDGKWNLVANDSDLLYNDFDI